MACLVAQHHRVLTTTAHHSLTIRRKARPEHTGKAGQTSRQPLPGTRNHDQPLASLVNSNSSVDRGLVAEARVRLQLLHGGSVVVELGRLFGPEADVPQRLKADARVDLLKLGQARGDVLA
jgi:hypothetical protein